MSILGALLGRKKIETEVDPRPEVCHQMPVRPYRVVHANLAFYSDPECTREVGGARLVIIRSEDKRQEHHPVECMPTRKRYESGQILRWDIGHKQQWEDAWYIHPETGLKEKAWSRSVEFRGVLVLADGKPAREIT